MLVAFWSPNTWQIRWRFSVWQLAGLLLLFAAGLGAILVNTSSPFLYFQF